jgi:hypothetical protein
MGRDFLSVPAGSVEAQAWHRSLRSRMSQGLQLREYVARDYLVLYSVSDRTVDLLAIKHHGQLSFDFGAHWH